MAEERMKERMKRYLCLTLALVMAVTGLAYKPEKVAAATLDVFMSMVSDKEHDGVDYYWQGERFKLTVRTTVDSYSDIVQWKFNTEVFDKLSVVKKASDIVEAEFVIKDSSAASKEKITAYVEKDNSLLGEIEKDINIMDNPYVKILDKSIEEDIYNSYAPFSIKVITNTDKVANFRVETTDEKLLKVGKVTEDSNMYYGCNYLQAELKPVMSSSSGKVDIVVYVYDEEGVEIGFDKITYSVERAYEFFDRNIEVTDITKHETKLGEKYGDEEITLEDYSKYPHYDMALRRFYVDSGEKVSYKIKAKGSKKDKLFIVTSNLMSETLASWKSADNERESYVSLYKLRDIEENGQIISEYCLTINIEAYNAGTREPLEFSITSASTSVYEQFSLAVYNMYDLVPLKENEYDNINNRKGFRVVKSDTGSDAGISVDENSRFDINVEGCDNKERIDMIALNTSLLNVNSINTEEYEKCKWEVSCKSYGTTSIAAYVKPTLTGPRSAGTGSRANYFKDTMQILTREILKPDKIVLTEQVDDEIKEATELNLIVGGATAQLGYKLIRNDGKNVTYNNYIWKSSDESKVKVTADGVVQGVGKADSAYVWVETYDGDSRVVCNRVGVKVIAPIKSLSITDGSNNPLGYEMNTVSGNEIVLKAERDSAASDSEEIVWRVDDLSLAAVDNVSTNIIDKNSDECVGDSCKVYFKGVTEAKTVTILAMSKRDNSIVTKQKIKIQPLILADKIILNEEKITIDVTHFDEDSINDEQYSVEIIAKQYSNGESGTASTEVLIWKTDRPDLINLTDKLWGEKCIITPATITDQDTGSVTTMTGKAYVWVESKSGKVQSDKISVEIYRPTNNIYLTCDKTIIPVGETVKVQYTNGPESSTEEIEWEYDSSLIELAEETDRYVLFKGISSSNAENVRVKAVSSITGVKAVIDFIVADRVNDYIVEGVGSEYIYDGTEKKPEIIVKTSEGIKLEMYTDYTLKYGENKNVGKGFIQIIPSDRHQLYSEKKVEFDIIPRSLDDYKIHAGELTYDGKEQTPEINVSLPINEDRELRLAKDEDYTCEYINNINAGTMTVKVTGVGNFTGCGYVTYTIKPKSIKLLDTNVDTKSDSLVYNGKPIYADITLKDDGKQLVRNADYILTYFNNVNAGEVKVEINGIGNYTESKTTTYQIQECDLSKVQVRGTLKEKYYVYKHSDIKPIPDVYVKQGKEYVKLINNVDYKLSYENNSYITSRDSAAYVIIEGIGNYKEKYKIPFYIHERVKVDKSKIKKLAKKNKYVTVMLKKVKNADGYEVAYSKDKKFSKYKVRDNKKTEIKLKLKKGTYFIKARVYKKTSLGNKVYSSYTRIKKIRFK